MVNKKKRAIKIELMNRIKQKLQENKTLLSIYFTAGYPKLEDTAKIIDELQNSGVDMVEIGLPFSDPLADGPTIQKSSTSALENGMTSAILFEQLKDIRKSISIPLLIMGYFNPILQYGVEAFCKKCLEVGIDGLIIPDLPLEVFEDNYGMLFKKYGLINIFLITPQTSNKRIEQIDKLSYGFIYMVSSASTTGAKSNFGKEQIDYFEKINSLGLTNPQIVGFGIRDAQTFKQATTTAKGAIIGSAFIQHLTEKGVDAIGDFVKRIR